MIERFVIILYDRANIYGSVNEAWGEILCKKIWNFENIPLIWYAVHPHVMKVALLIKQKHNMGKVNTVLPIIPITHL